MAAVPGVEVSGSQVWVLENTGTCVNMCRIDVRYIGRFQCQSMMVHLRTIDTYTSKKSSLNFSQFYLLQTQDFYT